MTKEEAFEAYNEALGGKLSADYITAEARLRELDNERAPLAERIASVEDKIEVARTALVKAIEADNRTDDPGEIKAAVAALAEDEEIFAEDTSIAPAAEKHVGTIGLDGQMVDKPVKNGYWEDAQ